MRSLIAIFVAGALISTTVPCNAAAPVFEKLVFKECSNVYINCPLKPAESNW